MNAAQQPTFFEVIERLCRIEAMLGATPPTSTLLTRAEASAYAKRNSERTFRRWCKKWGVKSASRGRYSRDAIDLALAREAGTIRTPASMRRKQEVA